jgi:hypothetical protein
MISPLEVLFMIMSLSLSAAIAVIFVGKTGHPKWWGLLLLVPVANIVFLLFLLVSTWPVTCEACMRRLELRAVKSEKTIEFGCSQRGV